MLFTLGLILFLNREKVCLCHTAAANAANECCFSKIIISTSEAMSFVCLCSGVGRAARVDRGGRAVGELVERGGSAEEEQEEQEQW